MIPAVAQTLAEILAGGNFLSSTEQIDFNPPLQKPNRGSGLNLYCYDLRENKEIQGASDNRGSPIWFDISFLVSAWDSTALGEQHLLSEALALLLCHPTLPEEMLVPVLRGCGALPMRVSADGAMDVVALWRALGVPLRPALYVTVTIPFHRQSRSSLARHEMWLAPKLSPVENC
jgi:hypothetical protein